jgi:hypothetical protein
MFEQPTQSDETQCLFDEILNAVDFGLIQGFPLDLYLRIKEKSEFQVLLDQSEPFTEWMWLSAEELTQGVEVDLDSELNPDNEQ